MASLPHNETDPEQPLLPLVHPHGRDGPSPSPSSPPQPPPPVTSVMQSDTSRLLAATVLTGVFFVVELVGGYFANSLAIMSDAAHLLSDVAGFSISLVAIAVATMPANAKMSYGYARAEVLGAFISIFFIWALTALLVVRAVYNLMNPAPVDGKTMLVLGVLGLLVNLALAFVLGVDSHFHGHGHDHGHGHSHDHAHGHGHGHGHGHNQNHNHNHNHAHNHTHAHDHGNHHSHAQDHIDGTRSTDSYQTFDRLSDISSAAQHNGFDTGAAQVRERSGTQSASFMSVLLGSNIESVNVRAAYLHVLGDALQSVGVIVAALVIYFKPGWSFVDALCTLLFAVLVILTTKGVAVETLSVLMEGSPQSISTMDVYSRLRGVPGIAEVRDLHVWSISANRPALSVHVVPALGYDGHDVLKNVQRLVRDEFGVEQSTVQVNCETSSCLCSSLSSLTTWIKEDCAQAQRQV